MRVSLVVVALLSACGTEHGSSPNPLIATVDAATGQGSKGDKGDTGATGPKGDKGDTGATGAQGIQGIQGSKGDSGIPALAENEWIDPITASLWLFGDVGPYDLTACTGDFTTPNRAQLYAAYEHGIFVASSKAGATTSAWYTLDGSINHLDSNGLNPPVGTTFGYFCIKK